MRRTGCWACSPMAICAAPGSSGGSAQRSCHRGDDPQLQDHCAGHTGRRGPAHDAGVQINALPVVDCERTLLGVYRVCDLLRAGVLLISRKRINDKRCAIFWTGPPRSGWSFLMSMGCSLMAACISPAAADELKALSATASVWMFADAGVGVAVISGRRAASVERRLADLGIVHAYLGVHDKRVADLPNCWRGSGWTPDPGGLCR